MEHSVCHCRILYSPFPHSFLPSRLLPKKLTFLNTPIIDPTNPLHRRQLGSARLRSLSASLMDSHSPLHSLDSVSPLVSSIFTTGRIGEVNRVTKETNVFVKINLDGTGVAENCTGIPFLDHMLDQLASHGLLDMHVKAKGDIHIDDHHTNEDIGLAIGTALLEALGDRKGINRFGDFSAPLDESLIHVALDLSGRPHLSYDLQIPTQRVGTYDTQDFLAGRTLLPVRGQHFWSDTSYTTASWKKFSSHY